MAGPRNAASRGTASTQVPADRIPRDIRIGDTVVYSKYGGQEITIDGEDLIVLSARDVRLVAEVAGDAPDQAGTGQGRPSRAAVGESLRRLLEIVGKIRAEEAAARRPELLKAMMAASVDPVPRETIEQARRLARQRQKLLATGAYTTESLRELRGDASASSTRTWLARRRAAGELFSITHEGNSLVPAFQLDEIGSPLPSIAPVLAALAPAELSAWATWTWLASSSPWLGGAEPWSLLASNPERVTRAASRFVANAA